MKTSAKAWTERAEDLRKLAAPMAAGEERDALLSQAEQLETAAAMSELLSVRKPPRTS